MSRLDPRAGAEVARRGLSAISHVRLLGWRKERELRRRREGTFSAGAFLRLRLRRVCAPGGGDRGIAGRRLVSSWVNHVTDRGAVGTLVTLREHDFWNEPRL